MVDIPLLPPISLRNASISGVVPLRRELTMRRQGLFRLHHDEEGVTAIIVALCLISLVGMLVLVVDVGGLSVPAAGDGQRIGCRRSRGGEDLRRSGGHRPDRSRGPGRYRGHEQRDVLTASNGGIIDYVRVLHDRSARRAAT